MLNIWGVMDNPVLMANTLADEALTATSLRSSKSVYYYAARQFAMPQRPDLLTRSQLADLSNTRHSGARCVEYRFSQC